MADKEAPRKATLARTVKDKWRSKHWYKVRAPGLFQHAELGETTATEPEQIIGRTLETTLEELTGGADVAKAHVKLRFQIVGIGGDGIADSKFIGHALTSDYVRRLARRKRSKIDLSVDVTSRDGVQFVLKPVAVGEERLQTRLRAELRHKMRTILVEEAKQRSGAELVREILGGDLVKLLAHGMKSLYPLKKIEIRASIVLGTIPDEAPSPEAPAASIPSATPEAVAAAGEAPPEA